MDFPIMDDDRDGGDDAMWEHDGHPRDTDMADGAHTDPLSHNTELYFSDHNVYRSYDLGRTHFENVLGYAFLKDANSYFHPQEHGEWAMETEAGMKQLFRNLYFEDTGTDGNGPPLKPFIRRWLSDPRRKEYKNITMDPGETRTEYLRVWQPYAAAEMPNIDDPEEVRSRAEFFIGHIRILLHGVEEHVHFMLMWFAFMLQRPGLKTQVAVILYGDHGIGKNAPFLWFAQEVLGIKHFFQTATMNDIVGEYAVALKGCRLCLFDEVCFQDSRAAIHKIKNLITNPYLNINEKHKKQITVKCLSNILFTTNSANAVPLQPTERRFVVFECSSEMKQNHNYFAELHKNLNNPRTARALYQFLMNYDISHVGDSLQAFRPITDHYMTMKTMGVPYVAQWLSDMCNHADTDASIASLSSGEPAAMLFKRYKDWLSENNMALSESVKRGTFFVDLRNTVFKNTPKNKKPTGSCWTFNGLLYKKANSKTIYGFAFKELRDHLVKNELYVEDGY